MGKLETKKNVQVDSAVQTKEKNSKKIKLQVRKTTIWNFKVFSFLGMEDSNNENHTVPT